MSTAAGQSTGMGQSTAAQHGCCRGVRLLWSGVRSCRGQQLIHGRACRPDRQCACMHVWVGGCSVPMQTRTCTHTCTPCRTNIRELFLPRRMAFVYDFEADEYGVVQDIPTTVRRSKADCPTVGASAHATENMGAWGPTKACTWAAAFFRPCACAHAGHAVTTLVCASCC